MSDIYYDIVVANNEEALSEVRGFVQVTQAEYDALTPADDTLYIIIG